MKKIIISLLFIFSLTNSQAQQQTVVIGGDTLQWLQTNLADRSTSYFSGKSFKTVLDSLYQFKESIVEFDPPMNILPACGGNTTDTTTYYTDPTYLFVDSLTMYFSAISYPSTVWRIQRSILDNNYNFNLNNTINTHVKYFRVVFQQPVAYPRQIARSDNGTWLWTPFAEYFWGPHIIQSVSVGEY